MGRQQAAAAPQPLPATGARHRWLSRRGLLLLGLQLAVLVVSAGVIVLLLRRVDPGAVIRSAGHVSWRLVGLAIALNIPPTLLRALRSQLLVSRLGHHVPFWRMNVVDLAGQTMSWITPAATGDLSRPYLWRNRDRVPVSAGVAVVVYERLVTLTQLGLVGGVLAASVYLPPAAVAGLGTVALVLLAAPWWLSLLTRRFAPREQAARRTGLVGGLLRALVDLEELGLSARLTGLFALCTLLVFAFSGLQIMVLASGLGVGLGLGVAIAAYCASQVAGSISTLPFGIGASDAVMVGLLAAGGLARVDAAAIALLVRLAITLPLGMAGAAGILALGRPRIPEERVAEAAAR
jgi:uncharacterized protein (TIRG00374 family)